MSIKSNGMTLADVARKAGVHPSTAGAILNDTSTNTRVSQETRDRVLSAAKELNYTPNLAARGLRKGKFYTIGIITQFFSPELSVVNNYTAGLLHGVIRTAHANQYSVVFPHTVWDYRKHAVIEVRGKGIDGYIVIAPLPNSPLVDNIKSSGIEQIVIAAPAEECNVPTIMIDNKAGIKAAIQYLRQMGHQKIAFLADNSQQYDSIERIEEYINTMKENGLYKDEYLISLSYTNGILNNQQFINFINQPDRPTAAIAINDMIAHDVYTCMANIGLKVPDDLSIVGFDDSPISKLLNPPLTTLQQPLSEIGVMATTLLINKLNNKEVATETIYFHPELLVRGSVKVI
jgi:LacI family transcriptional regulator